MYCIVVMATRRGPFWPWRLGGGGEGREDKYGQVQRRHQTEGNPQVGANKGDVSLYFVDFYV